MSEKNKRTISTKTGNTPRDGQAFAIDLKSIFTQLSTLCGDSEGFKDYARLHSSENRLKSELEKKEQELNDMNDAHEKLQRKIDELKNEKEVLKREFASSAMEWDQSSKRHTVNQEELSQVKPQLKLCQNKLKATVEENSQLSRDLSLSLEHASKLESRCKIQDLELQQGQLRLESYKKDQEQLKDELGIIPIDEVDMYASPKTLPTNY
jgi:chromosome segregation ATPase